MNKENKEQHPPLSLRKKLVFSLIIFGITGIIFFVGAEILVRLTKDPSDLLVLTGRQEGANQMEPWAIVDAFSAYSGRPGNYEKGKTINRHGFISTPEITIKKPESTIRIVFLGGSSTAGTGKNLADKDTWPWIVKNILEKKIPGKKIECINAALGGYTSFESYGRLWSRVRFYSPDIIIVNHGWNEMYYFDRKDDIVAWRTCADGSWGFKKSPKVVIYPPLWIDPVVRYSQLLTKARLRLTPPINGEAGKNLKLEKTYDKSGLKIFRTNLQLIKKAAEIMNAKLLVVKQATLIVPGLAEADSKRCCYHFHGFDHDAHVDAFNQIYRIIDEEIAPENIIATNQISGVSEYFYDHIHPTELGSQKIAKIVADAILPNIVELNNPEPDKPELKITN